MVLPKPLALGVVVALLVAGCSSGKESVTPTSTTRPTTATTTTTVPVPAAAPVELGPCPKIDPAESGVPINEGVPGLAEQFVPLAATTVRVCKYQRLANGSDAVTSGVPLLPAVRLEAETNRLARYPIGSSVGGGCVESPPDLFVTFANDTQRASVVYTPGCAAPAGNRVMEAHPTEKWLADIENFSDHSLTADDITGTWQPVSFAGYHGPLHSPPLAVAPVIAFDGTGKWTGTSGCNYTSGSYRLGARNAIRFTEISTLRRCVHTTPPDPLRHAARVELHNAELTFFGPAGRKLAQYKLVDLFGPPVAKR